MVDFDTLKANGYDLFGNLIFQGWEYFFKSLKGPVYELLVKQLWVFVEASNLQVTSYVLGHKISISKRFIATFMGHDGSGKWCFSMLSKKSKMEEIA